MGVIGIIVIFDSFVEGPIVIFDSGFVVILLFGLIVKLELGLGPVEFESGNVKLTVKL